MTRRFAAAVGALVAAVSFSSCATFDRNDVAVMSGGHELSVDELAAILASPLAGATGPIAAADGDTARNVIEVWLTNTIITDAGLLPEYDAEALRARLAEAMGDEFTSSPPEAQELLVVNRAIVIASESGTIDDAEAILALLDADVWVNARYGAWDAPTQSVLPFGA